MFVAVAMAIDNYVYGVLLVEEGKIKRAWIDPEFGLGRMCDKMEFRSDDLGKTMKAIQAILDVRYIHEVNPKDYEFDLNPQGVDFWKVGMN